MESFFKTRERSSEPECLYVRERIFRLSSAFRASSAASPVRQLCAQRVGTLPVLVPSQPLVMPSGSVELLLIL